MPHPAGHAEFGSADAVLAHLLGEHDVTRRLPRPQETAVLDLTVELADGAKVRPAEVGAADEVAGPVGDLPLEHRPGQARPHDRHPAARLADALGTRIGERDRASCRRGAAPPGGPQQRFCQRGAVHDPPGQSRVDHDHRLLERHRPRDVDHRARHGRDHDAVDHHDLVDMQWRDVHVHDPSSSPTRSPCTRHVHPLQWHLPQRQSVHDGSRHVTDHGFVSQRANRACDRQPVSAQGLLRERADDVGAPPDAAEIADAQEAAHLVVGEPRGEHPRSHLQHLARLPPSQHPVRPIRARCGQVPLTHTVRSSHTPPAMCVTTARCA